MSEVEIEEVLSRRDDLSTFIVHLTSDLPTLKQILNDEVLMASNSFGTEPRTVDQNWEPPGVVCLSEAPLAHIWSLCKPIRGRGKKFGPYGLVFSRSWAREEGCNPVFYSNMTPRGEDWPHTLLNKAYKGADGPAREALQTFTRFIEPTGSHNTTREWWWEREWRHVDDLKIDPDHLVAVLCASDGHAEIEVKRSNGQLVPVLDPDWGLEQMLLALSGVSSPWPFPSSEMHPTA